MDTLGHADAPAACIVLESTRRAGPSVTRNASRREGRAEKERYPWSGENVGNPVRRSAGTRDLMSGHMGFFTPGHPPHAGEIREDPDSASKRQQWTTNDEDSADIEEYVGYPSPHRMVQLSG